MTIKIYQHEWFLPLLLPAQLMYCDAELEKWVWEKQDGKTRKTGYSLIGAVTLLYLIARTEEENEVGVGNIWPVASMKI